jgi:uncharacterized damage-inducible protein DinB
MRYQFLIDTYRTEITKVLSVWSMFDDADLRRRPHPEDPRGRSPMEHMVHQCVSEDIWFRTMLDAKVTEQPLPAQETTVEFMRVYARDSALRLAALTPRPEPWWEEQTTFFDVPRSRLWVMTRRLTHTAHHRGQQTAMLRMFQRSLHSTYGPTADTGGLMAHRAPTIYAYPDQSALLEQERHGRLKSALPDHAGNPVTERPDGSG